MNDKIKNIQFKGQHLQDKFVIEYFNYKRNGVYIDIGAYDGVQLSNTYILEKHFDWTGICFEPMEHQFEKLKDNRKNSINYNCAAYNTDGEETFTFVKSDNYPDMLSGITKDITFNHMSGILSETKRLNIEQVKTTVSTMRVDNVLEKHNIKHVDFLSIDTEGSELEILKSINFNNTKIKLIILENKFNENDIRQFLNEKGFRFLQKVGIDDVFEFID